MPRKGFYDDLYDNCNGIINNTSAKEYYDQFYNQFSTSPITGEINASLSLAEIYFSDLDRIHNDELNLLLLKIFQSTIHSNLILSQSPPLLQALIYRRFKKILNNYRDKTSHGQPIGKMLLMFSAFTEWHNLNN